MDVFLSYMGVILDALQQPMSIYGFTLSFYDIAIWSMIASVVAGFIREVFGG